MPDKNSKTVKQPVETAPRKSAKSKDSTKFWRTTALVLLGIVLLTQLFNINIEPRFSFSGLLSKEEKVERDDTSVDGKVDVTELQSVVIPEEGVELPIKWGDLGKKMVTDGVIDEQKFLELFQNNLNDDEKQILAGSYSDSIVMTQANSRFILDMLWAFGLANKNEILDSGEMTDEKYGGDASKFASTGGWSLSRGNVMNHFSAHPYVVLTKEQQDLVDRVSSGIYRPCCGNSTHFPDCNHGMAMLGLLELMAANGVGEQEMYNVALKVNSIWFPQTYLDLATYFKEQGQDWSEVDAKLVLGSEHSSAQGYQTTRQKIVSLPTPAAGGGGCGV
jgi:hypothetical protein